MEEFNNMSEEEKSAFDTYVGFHGKATPQILDYFMAKDPNQIKWVHSLMAGVEPFLKSPAFRESPIPLSNARTAFNRSLGEFFLMAMIYHTKNMTIFQEQQRNHEWKQHPIEMTCDKTLAIFGFGDIGAECARVAKAAVDLKILGVKRNPDSVPEHQRAWADSFHKMADAETILPQADFVLSVLPFTEETKNYFNYERFKQMKQGSVFINIGRGTTVVEDDLIRVLEEGHLKGAALDVYAVEPLSKESKLWDLKQVLMTPHCADITTDIADLSWAVFEKNLHKVDAGEPVVTPVNKAAGY